MLNLNEMGKGWGDEATPFTAEVNPENFKPRQVNVRLKGVTAVTWTHRGGQGAVSGPSYHHICYTRWSRAAGTRPPAPTLMRWSEPPCSRRTVASNQWDISQPAKQGGKPQELRSAQSADEAFELWRWGEETGRRQGRCDQEASS